MPKVLSLPWPDDWHVHFRDGAMLEAVVPSTTMWARRAVVMPNLRPPLCAPSEAKAYRQTILKAVPNGSMFEPLMTHYLTGKSTPDLVCDPVFFAAKLYPANATTHADAGVHDVSRLDDVFAAMEEAGKPLLVHGETPTVDIFDREAHFIVQTLVPLRKRFPKLKITLEHVTTQEGIHFVQEAGECTAATVTPHHLLYNRTDLLSGGIRPHLYCLPIPKRDTHQKAIADIVLSGHPRFFLGTDSAPHLQSDKESACGCAGVFNAPTALPFLATWFETHGKIDRLSDFVSGYGADFYGFPRHKDTLQLVRTSAVVPQTIEIPSLGALVPFLAGETLPWSLDASVSN